MNSDNEIKSIRKLYINYIKLVLIEKLGIAVKNLDETIAFFSLGVTSLISTEIMNLLTACFGDLSSTLLFEYPNINKLSEYLAAIPSERVDIKQIQERVQAHPDLFAGEILPGREIIHTVTQGNEERGLDLQPAHNKIAVIGMSGRFPGANNVFEYFNNLIENKDCITEIPANRWLFESLYSGNTRLDNRIFSKWGGFIDKIEKFDAMFFRILKDEADVMDPQQKLFLECSWEALNDAGYFSKPGLNIRNTGVYAGVTWNEFSLYANEYGYLHDQYRGAGSLYWSIPNRVSYYFDFTGPSLAVDSACSSSLTAVHLACQSIATGECEMALAGGVNLNLHPAKYLFLSQSHFLSADGRCKAFGADADGYVPGEGVAVIVMKPLAKAIEHGDYIYGIISSTALNHGGKVTGYTVPNPQAHKNVIQNAFQRAEINPEDIEYIECHGTGTELGDPIEITGLKLAFQDYTGKKEFCGIGSVKSNIGHLEAAAGIAGIIKILLSLNMNIIPATIYCEPVNSKINLKETPFYLVTKNQCWKNDINRKRIAGISSFGAGGSNAHCIIESFNNQAVRQKNNAIEMKSEKLAIPLSAHDEEALFLYAGHLCNFLEMTQANRSTGGLKIELLDLACTLTLRKQFSHRVIILASSIPELCEKLQLFIKERKSCTNVFLNTDMNKSANSYVLKTAKYIWAYLWLKEENNDSPYKNIRFQKIFFLPPYPFLKEHSWINNTQVLYVRNQYRDAGASIHPLLDRNQSTVRQGLFTKKLLRSDYYFSDHFVLDKPVIPGVCHLEIVRAAAEQYLEEKIERIYDVWFMNTIKLEEAQSADIVVQIENRDNGYRFMIKSADPHDRAVYSRGMIAVKNSADDDNADFSHDYKPLLQAYKSLSIKEFYAQFLKIGIVQKKCFQVIKEFRYTENEAYAIAELPSVLIQSFDEYILHPALLDGAIQTTMMHSMQITYNNKTILPFYFNDVRILNPLTTTVLIRVIPTNIQLNEFDINIHNPSGTLLVKIKGFVLREYRKKRVTDNKIVYYTSSLKSLPAQCTTNKLEKIDSPALILLGNTRGIDLNQLKNICTNAVVVECGGTFSRLDARNYKLDANNPYGYKQLLDELKKDAFSPVNFIYYIDDDEQCGLINEKNIYHHFINKRIRSLFILLKFFIAEKYRLDFYLIHRERLFDLDSIFTRAIPAFFRSIHRENSGIYMRYIQYDNTNPELDLVHLLRTELEDNGNQTEIIYRNGKRYLNTLDRITENFHLTFRSDLFKTNDVYLIIGGKGGLGLILAGFLLKEYGVRLIITGRSELNDDSATVFHEWQRKGWQIEFKQSDVTNERDDAELIAYIMEKYKQLNGIIFCAGIIEDAILSKKTWDSFSRVLQPKIDGVLLLDKVTRSIMLNHFIIFSSISSLFGNIGQSDYAYANGVLDAFVDYREELRKKQQRYGKTVSINWPYWQEGGMHLDERQLKAYKHSFPLRPLQSDEGMTAFSQALSFHLSRICVLGFDDLPVDVRNLQDIFKRNKQTDIPAEENIDMQNNPGSTRADNQMDEGELYEKIKTYFLSLFNREFKIPVERLQLDKNLEDYGIDSIAMINILNIIENNKRFPDLPKTVFLENNTIKKIIGYFAENYRSVDYTFKDETVRIN